MLLTIDGYIAMQRAVALQLEGMTEGGSVYQLSLLPTKRPAPPAVKFKTWPKELGDFALSNHGKPRTQKK